MPTASPLSILIARVSMLIPLSSSRNCIVISGVLSVSRAPSPGDVMDIVGLTCSLTTKRRLFPMVGVSASTWVVFPALSAASTDTL